MRVLHLVPSLGMGGAERQLYLLCRETEGRVSNRVTAIASEGRWAAPLREAGVEVECLHTPLKDPRVVWRLASAVRRAQPDVVHCWLPSANLLGALVAAGHPVVASVRNVDAWKPWIYRLADRAAERFWSAVVVNSFAGAAHTLSQGVAAEKVHVVPNGIEPRTPLTRLHRARTTVCAASRLVPQKRVDLVLDVARALPEADFLIAGDGPMREQLEREAGANVKLVGPQEDPAWLFASSDFFILTSEREGTSNALLEAMQAGCVPVATPAGDNARIVEHGVSGWIGSPDRMGPAMREMLAGWSSMSAAARRAAGRYTVPAMVERTLRIYEQVVTHEVSNTDPVPGLHQ
ncbi:MAG: glycosyltransferase [Bryobacteraceae bacterium]